MPYGETRVAATYAREIFRSWTGSELAENAVVDGTQVPLDGNGRRIIEAGTVMVYVGVNETQTLTITGSPSGGNWKVNGGANLPVAATAAQVQAAIEAVLGVGNVKVTGANGGPYTVEFVGSLAGRDVASLTTTNTFTGGSSPAVAVAVGTAGGGSPAQGQKVRPAASSGVSSGAIAGIMMHTTEFWPDTPSAGGNKSDAPVALWTKNCNFESSQLINYSGNAAAVKTAMCGNNGRLSNNNFE